MKKIFLSIALCCSLCICCGERPTYDDAIEGMQEIESFEAFARFIFETEGCVAGAASVCYGNELPQEYVLSRDSFYVLVDKRLAEYRKGHFVELRTVLYESAAAACGVVKNAEGANAVKALLKHCSAAVYIDGQRVCDPPLAVRSRYEEAKEKARKALEQAGNRGFN